jgi:DNA processing protein
MALIKKIKLGEKNYPEILSQIYDPPQELYVWGELKKREKLPLAIVGTRKVSSYGAKLAKEFSFYLAQTGFTIISGLALGVDGLAHKGALEAKGKTIAVLGSGLNYIYPASHKKLAEEIVKKGGAVISEYPPDTGPRKEFFPMRNRIVAGLSLGTLVIEAPKISGALITARLALEENREVMAVPSDIWRKSAEGSNDLLKKGAKVITSPQDVLEIFNLELKINPEEKEQKLETKEEKLIFEAIKNEPMDIDKIAEKTGLPIPTINATLTQLEAKNIVKKISPRIYGT